MCREREGESWTFNIFSLFSELFSFLSHLLNLLGNLFYEVFAKLTDGFPWTPSGMYHQFRKRFAKIEMFRVSKLQLPPSILLRLQNLWWEIFNCDPDELVCWSSFRFPMCRCLSGPLQSIRKPQDVICFLKAMNLNFQISISNLYLFKMYFIKCIFSW